MRHQQNHPDWFWAHSHDRLQKFYHLDFLTNPAGMLGVVLIFWAAIIYKRRRNLPQTGTIKEKIPRILLCLGWWQVLSFLFNFVVGFADGFTGHTYSLLMQYGSMASFIAFLVASIGTIIQKLPFTQQEKREIGRLKLALIGIGWYVIFSFLLGIIFGTVIDKILVEVIAILIAIVGTLTKKLPYTKEKSEK